MKFESHWVFGDDASINRPRELRLLIGSQIIILKAEDTDVNFAEYFWISKDTSGKAIILAFSVVD